MKKVEGGLTDYGIQLARTDAVYRYIFAEKLT